MVLTSLAIGHAEIVGIVHAPNAALFGGDWLTVRFRTRMINAGLPSFEGSGVAHRARPGRMGSYPGPCAGYAVTATDDRRRCVYVE